MEPEEVKRVSMYGSPEERAIPARSDFIDAGHGYDVFGLHPPTLAAVLELTAPLYHRYFEVSAAGLDRVPASGPAIVVANHAGVLPLDGALLAMNIDRETDRIAWVVMDHFVPRVPGVGPLFQRLGGVGGSRGNLRWLLENGALVVILPEGVSGTGKDPAEAYRLQDWRVGHAEFAIRHRAPVIPAAIIGSEEAWGIRKKITGIRLFGAPYLPIPRSLLPRRTPFRIHYGEPLMLHRGLDAAAADDPDVVARASGQTRAAVEALIERGLHERERAG